MKEKYVVKCKVIIGIIWDENGDTNGVHLYLGEEGKSIIMFIGHEEATYYTNEELTKLLRKIIL